VSSLHARARVLVVNRQAPLVLPPAVEAPDSIGKLGASIATLQAWYDPELPLT